MTAGNRPTKQQRTGTTRIISRPRETTTLSHLGSSIQEALKISACENTSTCLHASRNQLLLRPNLDAASMLQEIKDRPNLKDFPKTKMLYTEHKKLLRSVFHNRFTWPRAYNPPSASEIPFILGHSCSSQTRSCSDMAGLIYLSARIRRSTISSTDFSCCNSVSAVEPAGDFSLQSQGTLKPEQKPVPPPPPPPSRHRRTNLEESDTPSQNAGFCNFLFKRTLTLSILLIRHHHHSLLLLLVNRRTAFTKMCKSLSPHHDRRLLSSLKKKNLSSTTSSSSSSTEPPLLVQRSKA